MQIQYLPVQLSMICTTAGPVRCPLCEALVFAPVSSEFVEDGKIRYLWGCDTCSETTLATIGLVDI